MPAGRPMRDPSREQSTLFYRFAVRCTRLLLNVFSHWRVTGLEHIPMRGPLLVVCNHQSNADPPILVAMMPRLLHCMAKQEVFDGLLGPLARWYGAFPVRRGQPDRQAIQTALEHLANGSCVGMFPEGNRSQTGGLIRGHIGAGLIAVRSGAPILPVAIAGTGQLKSLRAVLRRPSIDITIGKPFTLGLGEEASRTAAAATATETIMRRIAALLPPEMHGVYTDPGLAGSHVRGDS
jgi:1-acyl-sn-glycerol-3-phosphate acyltransferase